jgi:hypothetical protein
MLPPKPRKPNHVTAQTLVEKARREAELAKALRANLRRRKASVRDLGEEEPSS